MHLPRIPREILVQNPKPSTNATPNANMCIKTSLTEWRFGGFDQTELVQVLGSRETWWGYKVETVDICEVVQIWRNDAMMREHDWVP